MIGGLIAAAVLLPAFVLIEARGRAPMLDLDIFLMLIFAAGPVCVSSHNARGEPGTHPY